MPGGVFVLGVRHRVLGFLWGFYGVRVTQKCLKRYSKSHKIKTKIETPPKLCGEWPGFSEVFNDFRVFCGVFPATCLG